MNLTPPYALCMAKTSKPRNEPQKPTTKRGKPDLIFPRAWRRHFDISAEIVAERMGIERESVLRMEREIWRMTPEKQAAYADAIGTLPENLWRKPLPTDVPIRQGLAIAAEKIRSKHVTK